MVSPIISGWTIPKETYQDPHHLHVTNTLGWQPRLPVSVANMANYGNMLSFRLGSLKTHSNPGQWSPVIHQALGLLPNFHTFDLSHLGPRDVTMLPAEKPLIFHPGTSRISACCLVFPASEYLGWLRQRPCLNTGKNPVDHVSWRLTQNRFPSWVFPKIGVFPSKWMVKIMENPIKNGWFGGTPIFGNSLILNSLFAHSLQGVLGNPQLFIGFERSNSLNKMSLLRAIGPLITQ